MGRGIRPMVLHKADTYKLLFPVLEKEPDPLKPARISRPPACTGYATRELLVLVTIRHASCKLELGLESSFVFPCKKPNI